MDGVLVEVEGEKTLAMNSRVDQKPKEVQEDNCDMPSLPLALNSGVYGEREHGSVG